MIGRSSIPCTLWASSSIQWTVARIVSTTASPDEGPVHGTKKVKRVARARSSGTGQVVAGAGHSAAARSGDR